MSSKIVGWLVGDWDGKKSDFKKNLNKKKIIWIKSEKEESCIFALVLISAVGGSWPNDNVPILQNSIYSNWATTAGTLSMDKIAFIKKMALGAGSQYTCL